MAHHTPRPLSNGAGPAAYLAPADDAELRSRLERFLPSSSLPPVTDATRALLNKKLKEFELNNSPAQPAEKSSQNGGKTVLSAKTKAAPPTSHPSPPMATFAPSTSTKPTRTAPPKPTIVPSNACADPLSSNNVPFAETIKTYVFLDLEATGLASAHPRTRITELSLVAVSSDQFSQLGQDLAKELLLGSGGQDDYEHVLPRVLNKLTLCFYPATQVLFHVSQLTGLDNYNLESQSRFDSSTGQLLNRFLGSLARPVCLLAHNGQMYDFPLLLAELENAGVSLDGELSVADTLPALRQVYEEEKKDSISKELAAAAECVALGFFDEEMEVSPEEEVASLYKGVVEKDTFSTPVPSTNVTPVKQPGGQDDYQLPVTPPKSAKKRMKFDQPPTVHSFQQGVAAAAAAAGPAPTHSELYGAAGGCGALERTPEKPNLPASPSSPPPPPKRRLSQDMESAKKSREMARVRKRLDFETPRSFSLPLLHDHVFGRRPRFSHGAEQDCLALMRVCAVKRQKLIKFIDQNRTTLSSVRKMW